MHDSLPLALFSAKMSVAILENEAIDETMMVSWCLLVIALTIPDLSSRTRIDLLEIGFWMPFFSQKLLLEYQTHVVRSKSVSPLASSSKGPRGGRRFYTQKHNLAMRLILLSTLFLLKSEWENPFILATLSGPLFHLPFSVL
jgi:hypothetical protein